MSNVIKSTFIIDDTSQYTKVNKQEEALRKKEIVSLRKTEEFLKKAKEEAQKILKEARAEADSYLEEAYRESKNMYEDVKDNAYREGYSQGYEEGKSIADDLIKEANLIKKENNEKSKKIIMQIESDVISLVINICEKIINVKLEEDREIIVDLISKGLSSVNANENITIMVSRDDFDIVDLSKERILSMASQINDIQVKVDNRLNKGSCLIETPKGSVDVSVQSQIDEIKKLLNNILNSE